MPLPSTPLIRLVISGAMVTDTWSVGLWLDAAGGTTPTPAQMNTYATSVLTLFKADVWSAASNPLAGLNPAVVTVSRVDAYFYTAGALVTQGTSTGTAAVGTGTTPSPAYVAMCVTLHTGISGRRFRGRSYLPATVPGLVSTTLQFGSSTINAIATNYATFLTALNGTSVAGSTNIVSVVSQVAAAVTGVTSVSIDSIPDTQHGRSNKFVAAARASATV